MSLKRILVVLAAMALVGTLAWAIWAPRPLPGQTVRLPDGTVLTLAGVTYGASNTLVLGKPLQKYLYKILPANFSRWLNCKTVVLISSGIPSNTPVFWLRESGSGGDWRALGKCYAAAIDEYGYEYEARLSLESQGRMNRVVAGGETFDACYGDPSDPHGHLIGLVFYDSTTTTNRLGTIMIPGKAMPRARRNTVAPLAETDAGNLHVQLLTLATGLDAAPYTFPRLPLPSTNGTAYSQLTFRMMEDLKPTQDWRVEFIHIDNFRGRLGSPQHNALATRDGNIIFNFDSTLKPANGPWKLRVNLVHMKNGALGEYVTFSNIPMADPGQVLDLGWQTNVLDGTLILEKVYGQNSPRNQMQTQVFGTKPFFLWTTMPVGNDLSLTSHSIILDGKPGNPPGWNYGSQGQLFISLDSTNTVKMVDWTFTVRQTRSVNFEVNSTWFPTNSAGGK